ncbi:MAG TPA: vWA domain-containing protein, partial [Gemmataceae bacterium]|nr:vWA domain-containing protein [Gemmataceae bacterium]
RHDRVCERVDSLTRTQAGRRLLLPDGINLLGAVARRHRIDLVGFARESWDVPPDQAESLFRPLSVVHTPLPKSDDKGQVTNDQGQATDLRVPLARALEQTGPGEGKVLGVVVLTDGQHNWGPSPVAKAVELGDQGVPIYPVALGSRRAPPDIAVIAITAPPAVFKDADAPVEVRFKVSGMEAQEIEVELWRLKESGDKTSLDKHTIRHGGADSRYHDRFQVRMDKVGTQRLLATVHAKAKDAKETFADNNSRTVRINVADDKAHVLLVDGEARWEYHYLANALLRDRAMQLQTVVFHQPRLGRIPEEELKKIGNPALALPAEPDGLAAFDCIIVGDVSPGQLPLPERLRLEKYVADRGGTLVVLAGKRYMPLAFGSLGSSDETDPLLKLLPIQEPRAVQPTQGFPITLTTEGTLAPFLQMDAAAEESAKRWGELPPQYWGITGRAKPGAVPLASLSADAPPAGNQLSSDRDSALIVRQNYGFGRVVFVGLDSTWRWRYKVGDTYHHRFWGQLIRWAASDKPLVIGNEHVRFGTREPVYRQGQEVDVVVRLGDNVPPLKPGALAGARILRQGNEGQSEAALALVPLARRTAQPRVLEGRVRDLPAGQYTVELAIPELADKLLGPPAPNGKRTPLRASFSVSSGDSDELIDLATNWPLLEELAAKSGGKVFTPENAAELVDLLTKRSVTRELRDERKLWQWWPTLVLFVALLTVEWMGRKLAGLP